MEGRAAIITGGSSGIGLATAAELLGAGVRVVLGGRDAARLAAAAAVLPVSSDDRLVTVAADVTAPATAELLVDRAREAFGRLDIVVNNAGGGHDPQPVDEIPDATWAADLELNLTAAFALCRAALPVMRTAGHGRIVNVASVAGRDKGRLSGPSYSASKAGLLGLTRHLAADEGRHGITVNAVAPGFVQTPRALRKWESLPEATRTRMLAAVPIGRFAEPAEVAHAIAFLADDRAGAITGACLDVNGGSHMC